MRRRTVQGPPTVRLGSGDKGSMETAVCRLMARGWASNPCPVDNLRISDIWHSYQPPDLVNAVKLLDSCPETQNKTGRYKTKHFEFRFTDDFVRASVKFSCLTLSDRVGWFDDWKSPFIYTGKRTHQASWDNFSKQLSVEELQAFLEWVDNCKRVNKEVSETIAVFEQIITMCNTVGQLHRLVPECLMLAPKQKQALLSEQAKRSAMPEGYFSLDIAAVTRMNNNMSKYRLLPAPTTEDESATRDIYEQLTWAHEIT